MMGFHSKPRLFPVRPRYDSWILREQESENPYRNVSRKDLNNSSMNESILPQPGC